MDATQLQQLLTAIDQATYIVSGFICALIFAVTWKG